MLSIAPIISKRKNTILSLLFQIHH